MRRSNVPAGRWTALLAASVLTTLLGSAWGASPPRLTLEPGGDAGTESLVVTLESGTPVVDLQVHPWGIQIRLMGVELTDPGLHGLRVVGATGSSSIRLERPGARVLAMTVAEGTLSVVVSQDAGSGALAGSATYRIGLGDVVGIAVYKNPDLSGDFTVSPEGTLNVPLVGAIPARGMTDAELCASLREILSRDYLVDPQVACTVKTYQSQAVYVTGAVGRSTRVSLRPGVSLKDVLSEAGVALFPGQVLVLTRTGSSGETFTIGPEDLEVGKAPTPQDGDVVNVQERGYFTIEGEVRKPGRQVLAPGLTLLEAIAMAEGLSDWASRKDVRIRRKGDQGVVEVVVNLKAVEDLKAPDPVIRPGDVILVRRRFL